MADGRYLTVESFKLWTRDEISVDDVLIGEAIQAAEQEIDNMLGRRMFVASGSSARVYAAPPRSQLLSIDDCTAVASITENGTALTGSDYQLEPLNGISYSGATVPYNAVRRLNVPWSWSGDGEALISITATWGWAAIPPQIVEACKIITSDTLSNRDVRNGIVAITEAAGISARENATVRKAVAQYRRASTILVR